MLKSTIENALKLALKSLYSFEEQTVVLQPTRKEFRGTYTFVTFQYLKMSKKSPEQTGEEIGKYLKENSNIISGFNVVKGFLNLEVTNAAWLETFNELYSTPNFGFSEPNGSEFMVEYSSPNTNKPLHLGHLRNNFLGNSVARVLEANGTKVHKVQIINDRGIHICKSMLAWQKFGNGETPESSGIKGDKLVGKYYVLFDQEYKKQIEELAAGGMDKEEAEKKAPIMLEAQEMLRKWEHKDPEVYSLWQTMNGWVYGGFDTTYTTMGVDFDKLYYESDTYLLGKDEVLKGVEVGIFYKKEDGSVWVDLTEDGLDHKLLLRADGTSVYMTQDIGTAIQRFKDYPNITGQVYTVGNEQDYHFKVLFLILQKLGFTWAKNCYHLSYGMVDLPSGKMKSREGTVVDADDLMQDMFDTARAHTEELGKIEGFTEEEASQLYKTLGLGALKYFLMKVDPKKRMMFNPEESIQFQGNTGPFIQYTHARISSILRKAAAEHMDTSSQITLSFDLADVEREIIYMLTEFEVKVKEAAKEYSPAVIAQYVYDLAKEYNRFYAELSIFNEENTELMRFRVMFSKVVADVLKRGMGLLGVTVPNRM
ncbi:MAG: arginine--tRNA ligase [Cyclobacteriaceae bacterium]|nr:arginine--tRNA ligase [Cyclobacteriaceae bacterium]